MLRFIMKPLNHSVSADGLISSVVYLQLLSDYLWNKEGINYENWAARRCDERP